MESVFLVSSDKCILEHNWRGRSYRAVLNDFISESSQYKALKRQVPPVLHLSRAAVYHVTTGAMTIVLVASKEVDSAYVFDLARRIAIIFEEYFGAAIATTDLIQNNFDTVTELLCELIDNGYPLTTEPNAVRDVVLPPSLINKLMNVAGMQSSYEGQNQLSTIPWRRAKLSYTNNEIFVDVLEQLSAIVDKTGRLVTSQIAGNIHCTTKLSGTPEVTVTVNPARLLEFTRLHPSVDRNRFNNTPGTLSFTPPDGPFSLLTYTTELSGNTSSPIPLSLQFLPAKSPDAFDLILSTRAGCPESIAIEVALPASCRNARVSATRGEYSIAKETDSSSPVAIRWLISSISSESSGSAKICLSATCVPRGLRDATHARAVATTNTSVSGLKIDSLKMQRTGKWKPYKGVKYMTSIDMIFRAW